MPAPKNLLSELDHSRTLTDAEASEKIDAWQARLAAAANRLHRSKRSAILVFEGTDAAGKGGAIRRLTNAMDARIYQVRSVAAPTDEERAHPYLWRFWRGLPDRGRMTIYDRSWYGRVLVERLEGFAAPSEWMRAYSEINEFEEQLVESGAILLKFWLAISPAEQLRRFKDRQGTPLQTVQAHPGRLAQPQEVGRLHRRRLRHVREDQHRAGELGDHLGGGQEVGPGAGAQAGGQGARRNIV